MRRIVLATLAVALPLLVAMGAPPAAHAAAHAALVKADRVLVLKAKRKLYLLRDGQVLRHYRVALGRTPRGAKAREGDGRTPEGVYRLDWRNPESQFYRSIHISYPDQDDLRRAAARGVAAGGDIMIHGLPTGLDGFEAMHGQRDWTEGCIAVTNEEIDEIWALVEDGTIIEIRP